MKSAIAFTEVRRFQEQILYLMDPSLWLAGFALFSSCNKKEL